MKKDDDRKASERAKSATSYGYFYNTVSGVSGSGIDAKEFLKFYL